MGAPGTSHFANHTLERVKYWITVGDRHFYGPSAIHLIAREHCDILKRRTGADGFKSRIVRDHAIKVFAFTYGLTERGIACYAPSR